jgi:hypothetical protein
MQVYVAVEVWILAFTLALDGFEWPASCPSQSTPRENTLSLQLEVRWANLETLKSKISCPFWEAKDYSVIQSVS